MAKSATPPSPDQIAGDAGRAMLAGSKGPERDATAMAAYGITGLTRYGGISRVYEEFERALQGPAGMKNYREMIDNCPVIGAVLFAAQHLCRGVNFLVKPVDDSPEALKAADFVKTAIFEDMSTTWPDTLSEILSMLPFGWALLEMTFKKRAGMKDVNLSQGQPSGADVPVDTNFTPSRFDDGLLGFKAWSLRSQETLFMWEFDEESNAVVMQQMAPPDYRVRRIPLTKALLFRTQVSKNNPEGRSLLRNAWTSYYFRKNIQIIEGIGIERDMAGYPVIQLKEPNPTTGLIGPDIWNPNDPQAVAQLANLQRLVRSVRRDEQEGMVLPWWAEFKLLSTGARRQFNTNDIITRYDQRIAGSMLADFIMLGHDAVGSKALASTKTALFSAALDSFLDNVTAVINRQAIPLLLELNGLKQEFAPTMEHTPVESVDLADLADYIAKLSGAGMELFPNHVLEDALLTHAKLPLTDREITDEAAIDGQGPDVQEPVWNEQSGQWELPPPQVAPPAQGGPGNVPPGSAPPKPGQPGQPPPAPPSGRPQAPAAAGPAAPPAPPPARQRQVVAAPGHPRPPVPFARPVSPPAPEEPPKTPAERRAAVAGAMSKRGGMRATADRNEAIARAQVVKALQALGPAVDMKKATKAFAEHDVQGVVDAVDWDHLEGALRPALATALQAYGEARKAARDVLR